MEWLDILEAFYFITNIGFNVWLFISAILKKNFAIDYYQKYKRKIFVLCKSINVGYILSQQHFRSKISVA